MGDVRAVLTDALSAAHNKGLAAGLRLAAGFIESNMESGEVLSQEGLTVALKQAGEIAETDGIEGLRTLQAKVMRAVAGGSP